MHTQPSSAHLESLALCFLSSAAKAADPVVTLASGKLLAVSGDVTVKSNAAGFPIIQFAARTSAGRVWRSSIFNFIIDDFCEFWQVAHKL